MANIELKLPKMGESVAEATITNWLKEVGDTIEADEAVLEIATDKVDSEVPSEVDGVLKEKLFEVDDVVQVGQTIAIIEVEGEAENTSGSDDQATEEKETTQQAAENIENDIAAAKETTSTNFADASRFYSPLVKNIAKEEGVSLDELEKVEGTGLEGRVTKDDMLTYVKNRGQQTQQKTTQETKAAPKPAAQELPKAKTPVNINAEDEIVEMTRMGKMIASHMTNSKQTSAHVQSFIEVDVTNIWNWRNKHKKAFQDREGEKLTFTPIFMEAVVKAIKDFPGVNIQVDGTQIIKKKNINLGMAAALPNGDLIVPVI
ncbi:MAG: dihydrolipoamide acetyltransferase family protein, partial [Psychroflexus sp.]